MITRDADLSAPSLVVPIIELVTLTRPGMVPLIVRRKECDRHSWEMDQMDASTRKFSDSRETRIVAPLFLSFRNGFSATAASWTRSRGNSAVMLI